MSTTPSPSSLHSIRTSHLPTFDTPQGHGEDQRRIIVRRVHVQVVHRHGDRSPITALNDEAYWQAQLLVAASLSSPVPTDVVTDNVVRSHKANGRGPFGKLTTLGWQQMVDLGRLLRQEFFGTEPPPDTGDSNGSLVLPVLQQVGNPGTSPSSSGSEYLMYPHLRPQPPTPRDVQVVSTSFERAIQSAQGVLSGLFESATGDDVVASSSAPASSLPSPPILIDARHTVQLLPDPQPRTTAEQVQLEDVLAARPHLQEREEELLPLALRVTHALHPLLADDAHEAVFGAKQHVRSSPPPPQPQSQLNQPSQESIELEPLAWNQLAEITKCLAVRDKLAEVGITADDHHAVVQHAAWRWLESFRHPRLAYLSMHPQVQHMLDVCQRAVRAADRTNPETQASLAPLVLYSAHDSTLIGLLCALKLEQPVSWPEYGSFLCMELLHVTQEGRLPTSADARAEESEWYLRFSLNGQVLRSQWETDDHDTECPFPDMMIPLHRLMGLMQREDEATRGLTETADTYRYVPKGQ